jgi:hypothetical protein
VEQARRRKRQRPLPSRGNHRPLQGPFPGEQYLPVLGAYVRAQSVDPAVGGRAIRAQRTLRRVYVEVVPTIGHLLPAGAASPQRRAVKRHGEHLVIREADWHARHRTCKTQQHLHALCAHCVFGERERLDLLRPSDPKIPRVLTIKAKRIYPQLARISEFFKHPKLGS